MKLSVVFLNQLYTFCNYQSQYLYFLNQTLNFSALKSFWGVKLISNELAKFVGKIKQRPSSVSAIKIDGKSAHARVRAGEQVEIPERDVTIDEILVKEIRVKESGIEVDISVTCSAGTYIRAIARDLGEQLKVGGHLISLRRTLVSPFSLKSCQQIKQP